MRFAEEAKSRSGMPVTAPDNRIRIKVVESLVRFSSAFPRRRTKITAGIKRVEVSTVKP
jgi:hypothetical protein